MQEFLFYVNLVIVFLWIVGYPVFFYIDMIKGCEESINESDLLEGFGIYLCFIVVFLLIGFMALILFVLYGGFVYLPSKLIYLLIKKRNEKI